MSQSKLIIVLLVGLALALLSTRGADQSHAQAAPEPAGGRIEGVAPGDTVTLFVRGDATGVAISDRVPSMNNLVTQTGKLFGIDAQWVVVDAEDGRYAFPREAVLAIRVSPAQKK